MNQLTLQLSMSFPTSFVMGDEPYLKESIVGGSDFGLWKSRQVSRAFALCVHLALFLGGRSFSPSIFFAPESRSLSGCPRVC
jgi:hypothetical protein